MKKQHSVGMLCLALLLCVGLSGALLGAQLVQRASADTVIALTAEPQTAALGTHKTRSNAPTHATRTTAAQSAAAQSIDPGFTARDDQVVWETDTAVEIFHAQYDETGQITVDGTSEKVFAPGTGNQYDFVLKNTGNVALDYRMWVEVITDTGGVELPLMGRLCRGSDGWLAGSESQWLDLTELDQKGESRPLQAGASQGYSLEWEWPYERGEDEADTGIGNTAVQRDMKVTVIIHTVAMADENAVPQSALARIAQGLPFAPQTGDSTPILLLCLVCAVSGAGVLVLVLLRRKKRKDDDDAPA